MYVCVNVRVCMYVCVFACMYIRMYVCGMYVCSSVGRCQKVGRGGGGGGGHTDT